MLQPRTRDHRPLSGVVSLRPSTPTPPTNFSRTLLMETAFRPDPHPYSLSLSRSGPSSPGINSRPPSNTTGQHGTAETWKPFTIRLPYLILLNTLTLVFIIIIEILYHYGNQDGGILFMKDMDDLPLVQFFAIQYLPTLVAVLYGICWSIVDLDSKRLEPFYDLSQPGGTTSDALFLEYQYQFSLFVPFRALARQHWAVFLSSTIFLTASIIITPLQSSLLTTVDEISTFQTYFNVSSQFRPLNGSDSALTPEFLFTEYTINNLNGSLPPFTDAGDSFLPVVPAQKSSQRLDLLSSSNWTVTGESYSLAVSCFEPSFVNVTSVTNRGQDNNGLITYTVFHEFQDGVCNSTQAISTKNQTLANAGFSYGYQWARPDVWCGFKNTTTIATFLKWNWTDDSVELKSVLCELKGVQGSEQEIVINATTHAIVERNSAKVSKDFFRRDEVDLVPFNTALFYRDAQEVLGSDVAVFADADINLADILFNKESLKDDFLNISILQKDTEKLYRHLFSLAASTSPAYLTPSSAIATGKITIQGQSVVVDRTFATVSDVFLGFILLMGIIMCAYSYQRRSFLHSDPDSLSATMAIISRSGLPSKFKGLDRASTKLLKSEMRGEKAMLGYAADASGALVYKLDGCDSSSQTRIASLVDIKEEQTPVHLRLSIGASFFLALIAVIVFLSLLYVQSRNSGLPLISGNSLLFNLIWAFIPTLIATLLEPVWTSINRDVSVLQPFYNLLRRKVSAKKSLSLKYQTIPIILTARSLLARDLLLSLVSFMTVLVSVLSVTLPGIFLTDLRPVEMASRFSAEVVRPMIPAGFYFWTVNKAGLLRRQAHFLDAFAAAHANLSNHVNLPPWSVREHAFIPVKPIDTHGSENSYDFYDTYALGVSGSMDCRPIINGTNGESVHFNSNGTTSAIFHVPNIYPELESSATVQCGTVFGYKPPTLTKTSPYFHNVSFGRWPFPSLDNPGELYEDNSDLGHDKIILWRRESTQQEFNDTSTWFDSNQVLCLHIVPVVWSRRSYRRGVSGYVLDGQPEETLLVCQPRITVANFSVQVDRLGNVQKYQQLGNSSEIDGFLEPGFSKSQFRFNLPDIFRFGGHLFRVQDWEGLLMTRLAGIGENYLNPDRLAELANQTFALSFSIFASQNRQQFFLEGDKSGTSNVQGSIFRYEKRVVMSLPLTIISLVILGIFCSTLTLVYSFRRKRYLPRQPTTLASIIAYCQDSRLLDDIADTWHMSTKQRQDRLEQLGYTYGFGWYEGRDGERRLGVDKEPLLDSYRPL